MKPHPQVVFRKVGDETVLVHTGTNRIYSLNPTGAAVWELLAAGHDAPRIREQLQRTYNVEPARLTREVDELLASFAREGLLEA